MTNSEKIDLARVLVGFISQGQFLPDNPSYMAANTLLLKLLTSLKDDLPE